MDLSFVAPESLFTCSLGLLAFCYAPRALAEDAACGAPRVHLELEARPEWQAEVPALRARLRELEQVDACAQVTIRGEAQGVSVNVTSGGRSASRLLTDPRDLVRTVEALVVLPPPVTEPPRDADAKRVVPAEFPPAEVPPPPPPPVTQSRMELGAGGAARWGGKPSMAGGGVAAFADLEDSGWLAGVSARWEFADGFVSAPTPSGFNMASGAVGVTVGRRIRTAALACDLLAGPAVVFESEEAFGLTAGSTEGIEASALDARLGAAVRASAPTSSKWRFYATGDVELSPRRLVHVKRLNADLPPLPAWTSGIALGLMWGTR